MVCVLFVCTKQEAHRTGYTHTYTFDTEKMFVFTLDLNFGFIGMMACKNGNRETSGKIKYLPVLAKNRHRPIRNFSLSLSLWIFLEEKSIISNVFMCMSCMWVFFFQMTSSSYRFRQKYVFCVRVHLFCVDWFYIHRRYRATILIESYFESKL